MIGILQAIRQLLGYSFLLIILLLSPLGWYFLYLLPKIKTDKTARNLWVAIDKIGCRICHGTYLRTISGWSGQWQNTIKRYKYQAALIDWLVYKISGEKNHCFNEYMKELKKGLIG